MTLDGKSRAAGERPEDHGAAVPHRPTVYRVGDMAVVLTNDPDEPVSLQDESGARWPYSAGLAQLDPDQARDLYKALGEALEMS